MSDQNQKEHLKITKSFISGGIAGALNKTIVAPVQRVKCLFVTSNRTFSYRLFVEDFVIICKKNGFRNLWRGNSMNIIRMFPHSAIDFATFDFLRGKFYKNDQSFIQKMILFACGGMAGVIALTATDPIQFVRIRLAMEREIFTYRNSLHAFRLIYERQGFLGFYKGYTAAVFGVIIYQGFAFSFYTRAKEKVKKNDPHHYNKWYTDFLLGGMSAFGQILAYPFDVLRKRKQGQYLLFQKGQITKIENYRQLITSIYQNERGYRGFFKGVSLNLIKAPLASASAWTMKNYLNRKLNKFYDF